MAISFKMINSKTKPRKRIVVCGSMSYYKEMIEQSRYLSKIGIRCVLPDLEKDTPLTISDNDYNESKRRASMKHIRRIRDTITFGILVVNCDKYDVADYIGPNTFAEIAIALAHYKKIYLYQGIPQFYQDELTAWGAISLNGRMLQLVSDFRDDALLETAQLRLFDF